MTCVKGKRGVGVWFVVVAVAVSFVWSAMAQDAAAPAATPAPAVAPAATGKSYSGTFSDSNGRKGPMQCQLSESKDGKWALKINAKNEGSGPQRSADFNIELPGKKEGETLKLAGTAEAGRQGAYEMTVEVTDKGLEAKFKKPDGKNSGTISLTPAAAAKT